MTAQDSRPPREVLALTMMVAGTFATALVVTVLQLFTPVNLQYFTGILSPGALGSGVAAAAAYGLVAARVGPRPRGRHYAAVVVLALLGVALTWWLTGLAGGGYGVFDLGGFFSWFHELATAPMGRVDDDGNVVEMVAISAAEGYVWQAVGVASWAAGSAGVLGLVGFWNSWCPGCERPAPWVTIGWLPAAVEKSSGRPDSREAFQAGLQQDEDAREIALEALRDLADLARTEPAAEELCGRWMGMATDYGSPITLSLVLSAKACTCMACGHGWINGTLMPSKRQTVLEQVPLAGAMALAQTCSVGWSRL